MREFAMRRRYNLFCLRMGMVLLAFLLSCQGEEECDSDASCPDRHYCEPRGCGASSVCVRGLDEGDLCEPSHRRCLGGLTCHHGYDPARCRPFSGIGEPCESVSDCASDTGGVHCNVVEYLPEVGTCVSEGSLGPGEPCGSPWVCDAGLACRPGGDGISICSPPGELGEPCDRALAFDRSGTVTVPPCGDGLYCAGGDTPTCQPRVGRGEPCNESLACGSGLVCKGSSRRCEPPSAGGEPCLDFTDCEGDLRCEAGSCAPRGEVGDACDAAWDCHAGLVCIGGRCEERRILGETCESDRHCLQGRCFGGTCGPVPRMLGESCDDLNTCVHGICKDGSCVLGTEGDPCSYDQKRCAEGFFCRSTACQAPLADGSECVFHGECASLFCDFGQQPARCL